VSAKESAAPILIDLGRRSRLAEPRAEVLRKADHLLRVPQHVDALGRDSRPVARPVEQRHAKLALQFPDAAGDCRLRQPQLARCTAEAAELRNPQQRFELVETRAHDPKNLSSLMEIF
jgi:hypothetical protein